MIHVLGQFFKANPNFAFLETLTAILRDQEYLENNMVNQLPDLIHGHAILEVHLVPQDDCFQNIKIRICIGKLA